MISNQAAHNNESYRLFGKRPLIGIVPCCPSVLTTVPALIRYFALVFTITWGVAGICLYTPAVVHLFRRWPASTNPLFYLAVYAPSVAATVLTAKYDGLPGLRVLFGRLLPSRLALRWCLIVLVAFPVVGLLAGRAAWLLGGPDVCIPHWPHFYGALVPALVIDPGPFGEELGWRGFALPRLLQRWSPLTASVVLGVIWGLWHLPAFFIVGLPQRRLTVPAMLLATVSVSVIDTWVFLRSRGNLLPPILVHLMTNHCFKLLGVSFGVSVVAGASGAFLILLGEWTLERGVAHAQRKQP